MKRILFALIMLTALSAAAQRPTVVVVPDKPTAIEQLAADELCHFGNLQSVSESKCTVGEGRIFIGATKKMSDSKVKFTPDSYRMFGDGMDLYIYGPEGKGTLYGVYDYLENFLGWRCYTPDCIVKVREPKVMLPVCDTLVVPSFEYREVLYYYPNHSRRYADWHHLHNRADLNREWGMFVHTFKDLIPADRYFAKHPDWFSMRNGRRVRDGQLCLTNPKVLKELCKNLSDAMARNPEATVWSVSNNDNYNACQCPDCLRSDSLYGGPSGTLLRFVNEVARRFPNKTISTLAYQYTRKAPEGQLVRPEPNVNIMLCSIECGREKPVQGDKSFHADMKEWRELTDNIFMWDYIVQFRNFWNPFPNLHVLQPNLKYFRDNGVRMMFEQATGENNITSWMDIRCYLTAKLLWNADANTDAILTDFCNGYYGRAGVYIKGIIDTMTAALVASGQRLDIYGYPVDGANGYLSPKRMAQYEEMIGEAFRVEKDKAIRQRVAEFAAALDFAQIELQAMGFMPSTGDELRDRIESFTQYLENDLHVPQMMEMGCTPAEYRQIMSRFVEKNFGSRPRYEHKMFTQPKAPYNTASLTDGKGGIMDYRNRWLGWFGDSIDVIVSLNPDSIYSSVSMDFYFYPLSWIFLPQHIEYQVSDDGTTWQKLAEFNPVNPEILATPDIKTFRADFKPRKINLLRVVAKPLPEIPAWHRATGEKPWIFTDEIVVKGEPRQTDNSIFSPTR